MTNIWTVKSGTDNKTNFPAFQDGKGKKKSIKQQFALPLRRTEDENYKTNPMFLGSIDSL